MPTKTVRTATPAAPAASEPTAPVAAAAPRRAAERIRLAAGELFYREGIRAVGVEEIVHSAGVTKPSLYRSFPSKDELAAAYLRDFDAGFWRRFEAPAAEHPGDPRGHLLAYMEALARRAGRDGYRGCGLSNAIIEYPDRSHPAHQVAAANKRALRERLAAMCTAMGAADPAELADGLLLLLEGSYTSSQTFGAGGPVRALVATATRLIDASLAAGPG